MVGSLWAERTAEATVGRQEGNIGAGEGKMMTFGIGMLRYRLLKLEFLMISFLLNKLYFLSQSLGLGF